jgi:hypothetical protein
MKSLGLFVNIATIQELRRWLPGTASEFAPNSGLSVKRRVGALVGCAEMSGGNIAPAAISVAWRAHWVYCGAGLLACGSDDHIAMCHVKAVRHDVPLPSVTCRLAPARGTRSSTPSSVPHAEWHSPRPIPKSFGGMHAVAHRRARQGGRLAAHAHRTVQIVLSVRASTLTLFATAVELVL